MKSLTLLLLAVMLTACSHAPEAMPTEEATTPVVEETMPAEETMPTEEAAAPATTEWVKEFQSGDAEACKTMTITCAEGQKSFSDESGCGCLREVAPTTEVAPAAEAPAAQ